METLFFFGSDKEYLSNLIESYSVIYDSAVQLDFSSRDLDIQSVLSSIEANKNEDIIFLLPKLNERDRGIILEYNNSLQRKSYGIALSEDYDYYMPTKTEGFTELVFFNARGELV